MSDASIFWSHVDVRGPSDCWEWTASRGSHGYGNGRWGGKTTTSQRVSWLINMGEIPPGMMVLHTCDNRGCVNPGHLFLGHSRDNVRDMHRKRRHPNARLTPTQVAAIRNDTRMHKDITQEYGISRSMVWKIQTGRAWSQ